jgi:hypothetical protein
VCEAVSGMQESVVVDMLVCALKLLVYEAFSY